MFPWKRLSDPLWPNTATTAATEQKTLYVFSKNFSLLKYYKCMVLTGRKVIHSASKRKNEGWGPLVVAAAQNMMTIFIYMVVIFV